MKFTIVCAVALGLALGLALIGWETIKVRRPLTMQFTDRQAGDVAHACRMAHGAPDYQPNGSWLCIPGGGAPTDLDEFLEKRRQQALKEAGL